MCAGALLEKVTGEPGMAVLARIGPDRSQRSLFGPGDGSSIVCWYKDGGWSCSRGRWWLASPSQPPGLRAVVR